MAGDDGRPEPLTGWRGALGRPTPLEARVGLELVALLRSSVWRGEGVPAGGGRPVLLIGGFLGGSGTLRVLTRWFERTGYDVHESAIGRNAGPSEAGVEKIVRALTEVRGATGRRALVVGHSRGGHLARAAAVRAADDVAGLVTLGSPHRQPLPPHVSVRVPIEALRVAGRLGLPGLRSIDEDAFNRDRTGPFPPEVPFWSVWSRTDGIVDWRASLDPAARSVEVRGSHVGLVTSARVYRVLADVLADEELTARW